MTDTGDEAARMLADAARISEPGPGVTRLPFTEEHRQAAALIEEWMRAVGLEVRRDAAGTIIGRRECGKAGARTLLVGSHQDSVREGGAFDGIMGVALPILALQGIRTEDLGCHVEVLAFADEEGVRFPTALLGPRALAGTVDPGIFDLTDREGVSLGDALRGFGGDPDAVASLARDPEGLIGYLEAHIEQGPVLEARDLPVGVVTAIAGIERRSVRIEGRAAHAGTTPMDMRHDALCAAAELVAGVERVCRETDAAVGTVGSLDVGPNVVNAVPGRVDCIVELRSAEDSVRADVASRTDRIGGEAAERRGCGITTKRTYEQPAKACDPALRRDLAAAVQDAGVDPLDVMSGATHDASAMADLCPMAMLFVRCREGISHNPREFASAGDMGRAVETIRHFILRQGAPAGRAA